MAEPVSADSSVADAHRDANHNVVIRRKKHALFLELRLFKYWADFIYDLDFPASPNYGVGATLIPSKDGGKTVFDIHL